MSLWTLDQIAAITGGRWLKAPGSSDRPPLGAALDTREIKPGMLFAAFRGEKTDGHAHIPEAALNGAAMAVATDPHAVPPGINIPVLVVPDATRALADMARFWRDAVPGLRVIGITGSNGKTTTCRLMQAAACGSGGLRGTSPAKSFNNELGVPITLLNARPDDQVLICEIGMSTPGEIAARCTLARPDAAIITTVAEAHFGGLGSLEAIAAEKASIAAAVPSGGIVVVPQGLSVLDAALAATGTPARIVRVGPTSDARLSEIRPGIDQTRFMLDDRSYQIPLPGAHNASNAALAVVVARWLGVPDDAIARGLAAATPAPMRLQRVTIATDPAITLINDAYNANPGSMRAALAVLADFPALGRRVAVLGDMLELGQISGRAHRDTLAAARSVDLVLTVGPAFAAADAEHAEPDASDEAIDRVAAAIRPGDTVLVKGSRGMRLERLVARLQQTHRRNGPTTPAHT